MKGTEAIGRMQEEAARYRAAVAKAEARMRERMRNE